MIGSAAQHRDIMASILAIITSPEMVAKNIEALTEKMAKSEAEAEAARVAMNAVTEAQDKLAVAQALLDKREIEIAEGEASLRLNRGVCESALADLTAREDTLANDVDAHGKKTKALEAAQVAVSVREAAADRREAKLDDITKTAQAAHDARVAAVAKREQDVAADKAALAAKVAALKALAQG